jgi:hypothetical protein
VRRSMIGIGSMALLGAISFAPAFAQQGGGQQGQQGGQQRQGQQGGMDRQGGMGQQGQQGQGQQVRVGSQAPEFNLFDLKGQVFVLEFINPTDQNWVKLHESGQLKDTYERYKEQGIVWLAICPFQNTAGMQQGGQPGQQGGMTGQQQRDHAGTAQIQGIAKTDRNQLMQSVKRLDLDFPVLYDEGAQIAKRFGINHIPHVVVVDSQSKVAYAGPLMGQGGQVAGIDQFDRALSQAIQTQQQGGSLPAGAPRGQQGTQGQGQGQQQDRERIERERERNQQQNRPR